MTRISEVFIARSKESGQSRVVYYAAGSYRIHFISEKGWDGGEADRRSFYNGAEKHQLDIKITKEAYLELLNSPAFKVEEVISKPEFKTTPTLSVEEQYKAAATVEETKARERALGNTPYHLPLLEKVRHIIENCPTVVFTIAEEPVSHSVALAQTTERGKKEFRAKVAARSLLLSMVQ